MVAFSPGKTTTLAIGIASGQINIDANAPQMYLFNSGTALVFVRTGTGPQVALATDFPLAPNGSMILTKGVGADTLAAIGAAAGGTLYVTTGNGG